MTEKFLEKFNIKDIPEIAVILGSGLGSFIDNLDGIRVPYSEIEGFSTPTISGHKGQLVFTNYKNKNVVFMQGRFHFYEGHTIQEIVYPIKFLKKIGVKKIIITNAAGGINTSFKPCDLMIITDHINLMGTNPLIGKNDESLGTRFPDMCEVYDKKLINTAQGVAKNLDIKLQQGIYAATTGPNYETPAEVKMLRAIGVDAVGMSTVPEAIVANYCGMKVLGISFISNYAAGITNEPLTHKEVIERTNATMTTFEKLILGIIEEI